MVLTTLLAEQILRDFLGLGDSAFLELEKLGAIVAVLVGLAAANELGQEGEARFLLERGEILVVLN